MLTEVKPLASLEDLEQARQLSDRASVVQLGSKPCVKCPEFTQMVRNVAKHYDFVHLYVDVHDAENELLEEFGVTRLPAFAIFKEGCLVVQQQSASPDDVKAAIIEHCRPIFTTNADF